MTKSSGNFLCVTQPKLVIDARILHAMVPYMPFSIPINMYKMRERFMYKMRERLGLVGSLSWRT